MFWGGHNNHVYPHFLSETNISLAKNPTLYLGNKFILIKKQYFRFWIIQAFQHKSISELSFKIFSMIVAS